MAKTLKLIGSRLNSLSANKNTDFAGKLDLKTNIKVSGIEKIKDAKDSLKVNYDFAIVYAELGKIELSGSLFISGDSKVIKEVTKQWDKKELESPEFLAITNMIMQKASVKCFELEEELGLPIHIRLPSISSKN